MREELELIVIGDDHVRDNVYSSVSSSVQESKRKAHEVPFPSFRSNDTAISLGSSTSAKFTLADKQISYGVHEYTNHKGSLNSDRTSPYLLKKYLTIVVCINADETGLGLDRFDDRINQLKAIRNNQPFNIIPMIIANNGSTQRNPNEAYSHLKATHPQLCRNAIVVDPNDLNNPEYTQHLSMILDISMATSVYCEVNNCIELLNKLEQSLSQTPVKPGVTSNGAHDPFDVTPILNILKPSLNMIGSADANTMDTLKTYFNRNRENLNTAFVQLKDDLNQRGDRNQTYIGGIFLNVLCSIAAVFASLTIVGIPFVYYALSQNSRYHNNCLKFFATNNIDADRASIVKVEDEMNRTVLSAH